ncbi:hypothetical protein [Streptosporangium sandarakinum]|uniref:hypothetical protein n=1 Tax=Streptosporangium sandarakinum TaxID=1260955 RepID=UPI00379B9932
MPTVVPARGGLEYGARLVLLFVLSLSFVVILADQDLPRRDAEELIADLRAGRVTTVVYDRDWPAYGTLTWSRGPLSWTQAAHRQPDDVWDHRTGELVRPALERRQGAFLARVRAAADPSVEIVRGGPSWFRVGSPAYARWWPPFAPFAVAAEVLVWMMMLTRRDHRFAGRRAWFWILLAGGSPLYALLEPYPLWRRPYEALPAPARLGGPAAFALAVTAMLALTMLGTPA